MEIVAVVGDFTVETNGSGELFVTRNNGPEIRLSPEGRCTFVITSTNSPLTPWATNGLSAIRVE